MRILIKILLYLAPALSYAQDMHFTQFYASPVNLNPGFTGAQACSRIAAVHRNQWAGIGPGYSTYLMSFDHYAYKQNMGVGFLFSRDISGSGQLSRTNFHPSLAYELKLSRELILRMGFQPGIGLLSVDFSNLLFGDQIARGGNVSTIENAPGNIMYFDMNTGVLAYAKDYWAGIAVFHLIEPEDALISSYGENVLPRKLSIHGGYKLHIIRGIKDDGEESVWFTFNYRGQTNFDQLDLGAYYTKSKLNLGLWYRGLPGVKAYQPGYNNHDAFAAIVGFKTERFNMGYSYDFTISKLTNRSAGSHEITLSAHLCDPKKVRRKPWPVPCPKF